jgi:hypothetical protein
MAINTKRLGENQKHILKGLSDGRLTGTGWVWGNRSTTLRLMKGLVSRGLVVETAYPSTKGGQTNYSWSLSEAGQKWVELENTPTLPDEDRRMLIVMMAEQELEWNPKAGWHLKTVQYTELGMKDLEKQGLVRPIGDKKDRRWAGGADLLDKAREYGYDPNLCIGE